MPNNKSAVRQFFDKIPPYPDGEDTPVYDEDNGSGALEGAQSDLDTTDEDTDSEADADGDAQPSDTTDDSQEDNQ